MLQPWPTTAADRMNRINSGLSPADCSLNGPRSVLSILRNGQEHGIGIAYDEIARLGLSDNPLLVEEGRWVLL